MPRVLGLRVQGLGLSKLTRGVGLVVGLWDVELRVSESVSEVFVPKC